MLCAQLERKAIDYATKFVNTAYLYETEDFVTGTLLEVPETVLAQAGMSEITVNGTASSVSDLKANLQQFADVAGLYHITIAARDGNPEIDTTTNGDSHSFTIRVYG